MSTQYGIGRLGNLAAKAIFRLPNSDDPDAIYEVSGNPHSQQGLVSLLPAGGRSSLSARFTDLVAVDEFSAGWLLGYASGNEPNFSSADLPPSRILREREFYYTNGYPLPVQRSGLFCINASYDGQGAVDVASVYRSYGRIFKGISDWAGRELAWAPVVDGRVLNGLLCSGPTSSDIGNLFNRVNPGPYTPDTPSDWELRLLTREGGLLFDTLEAYLSFERVSDTAYATNFTVNLDAEPISLIDVDVDRVSRSISTLFSGIVQDASVDCASISPSKAAKLGEGILFSIDQDSDPVLAFPGWLNFISARVANRYVDQVDSVPRDFAVTNTGNGVLIEFQRGVEAFGLREANSLARCFEE